MYWDADLQLLYARTDTKEGYMDMELKEYFE
jgi:hypothetical protein